MKEYDIFLAYRWVSPCPMVEAEVPPNKEVPPEMDMEIGLMAKYRVQVPPPKKKKCFFLMGGGGERGAYHVKLL